MQREMFPTDSPSKFDKSLMDAYSSIHEGARKGHAAGDSDVEKQASQLASDVRYKACLLYTSPSPRDQRGSRMPSSA